MKGRTYRGSGKGSAKATGPTLSADSRRYKSSSGNRPYSTVSWFDFSN